MAHGVSFARFCQTVRATYDCPVRREGLNMKTTERCTMRSVSSWVLLAAIVVQPEIAAGRTILPAGRATTWKYLDTAVEPGAAWREVDYDDAAWKSGPAPLGFGESAILT